MIHIDGSHGEGGGQVLRSSLTLSVLTGQPLRIDNIRARRSKPGLRAQHLASVQAAAAISQAEVTGATLGSATLLFRPGRVQPGPYRFDIGTAGSTSLVLQTIFLPLALAAAPSTVTISGGTHVAWSPSFDYLDRQWLPALRRMGYDACLTLERAGFYPKGGGRIRAEIRPAGTLQPVELVDRGALRRVSGISASANLPEHIARRQRQQVERRLGGWVPNLAVKTVTLSSSGPGTAVFLQAECEQGGGGFTALGRRGKPAERVADEAVDELETYLATNAAIDKHLADQLILPLVFAPGHSTFSTAAVTRHLLTNIEVVQAFLDVEIMVEGELRYPGFLRIEPKAIKTPANRHPGS
ncbi:MAG TPA: RNA 3'-terminal phosphate cyclase [Caldilineae bacterium]|nr:RNA 3'-terminal phosphate cyclase [Caldilineae bacterium]